SNRVQSSRRELLRMLSRCGTALYSERLASILLPAAKHACVADFVSSLPGDARTPGADLGFTLADVASQSRLNTAPNVYGGVRFKRYLMDELGCGVAFFDYDRDHWLDIFLVNGTRFGSLPSCPPSAHHLFHSDRH